MIPINWYNSDDLPVKTRKDPINEGMGIWVGFNIVDIIWISKTEDMLVQVEFEDEEDKDQ